MQTDDSHRLHKGERWGEAEAVENKERPSPLKSQVYNGDAGPENGQMLTDALRVEQASDAAHWGQCHMAGGAGCITAESHGDEGEGVKREWEHAMAYEDKPVEI